MKKIILGLALASSYLLAEVVTIVPYGGMIDYGAKSSKTAKDTATLYGVHGSVGTLNYLVEADYSHIQTKYISSLNLEDLKQDDISLVYGQYFSNFMYKVGVHYISTTDEQLKDGIVAIASLGGYNYFSYDKLSYGLEGYYSSYDKAHDEHYTAKSVAITQLTPYISYYKAINLNWANTIVLKANYQIASDYVDDSYSSFEISDTIAYNSFFTTFRAYTGEARTIVKDSGMTVYNTLDLMKNGYAIKLGYYLNKNTVISASYASNTYREFDQVAQANGSSYAVIKEDNTNNLAIASLSYSF